MKFEKFIQEYKKGIEVKENYDSFQKLIEKNRNYDKDNTKIIDFLFDKLNNLEDDLLKYRNLKLMTWFMYGNQNKDYYLKFKEYVYSLFLSSNGHIRNNCVHLVNDYRGMILMRGSLDFIAYKKGNEVDMQTISEYRKIYVQSFVELVKIYENFTDEKIKKNVLKGIEQFYCYVAEDIFGEIGYSDIYNKYGDIIFGKPKSLLERYNGEWEDCSWFVEDLKSEFEKRDNAFNYITDCNDIEKLREEALELQEQVFELEEALEEALDKNDELKNKLRKLQLKNKDLKKKNE